MKYMGIYLENNNTYSGAGVIVVEDYYKKDGTKIPCIVLVQNNLSQLYSDFGGTYETKHGSLQKTAHKELQEESIGLFDITSKYFTHYVDIPAGKHKYRVYSIKINGINRKCYHYNRNKIYHLIRNKIHVPSSWRETSDIAHIPIKNIDFDVLDKRGSIIIRDIEKRSIKLHGRVKKAIYHAQSILFEMIKSAPIGDRNNLVLSSPSNVLNDIYSFQIN